MSTGGGGVCSCTAELHLRVLYWLPQGPIFCLPDTRVYAVAEDHNMQAAHKTRSASQVFMFCMKSIGSYIEVMESKMEITIIC